MTLHIAPLSHRALLEVSGEDAAHFLQGLVSNDVRKATAEAAVYVALLTPQGKFLHDMFIIKNMSPRSVLHTTASGNDTFWLECERDRLDDLAQRLTKYKLRAKVTITPRPEYQVWALWGGAAPLPDGVTSYADPRHAEMGARAIAPAGVLVASALWEAYEAHRLQLGIADGSRDIIADKMFLLEAGFDDLHGVDFTKGCYVGQEVTARSKHRGGVRKFLFRISSEKPLPPAGTPLLCDGKEVGEVRSSCGAHGLALLRMEGWQAQQQGAAIVAGDITVKASLPAWASVQLA